MGTHLPRGNHNQPQYTAIAVRDASDFAVFRLAWREITAFRKTTCRYAVNNFPMRQRYGRCWAPPWPVYAKGHLPLGQAALGEAEGQRPDGQGVWAREDPLWAANVDSFRVTLPDSQDGQEALTVADGSSASKLLPHFWQTYS